MKISREGWASVGSKRRSRATISEVVEEALAALAARGKLT
jgi:hypothetical protein